LTVQLLKDPISIVEGCPEIGFASIKWGLSLITTVIVKAGEHLRQRAIVFDEIPSRPALRSQRFYIFSFAAFFVIFPLFSGIMLCFRWPHPPSLYDKIFLGSYTLISLTAGVLLLSTKSATPRNNQERLQGLFWLMTLVWLGLNIFQVCRR